VSTDPRIARTRSRVLDATWELLNDVGFDGVTVEQVSERSGVARSTLYRHWRSIPELCRDAFAAQAGDRTADGGALPPDGLAALTSYARAVAHGLTDVWGRAAVSLAVSAAVDPEQREVQQVFVHGTRRDLRLAVDAGRASGELDAATDPDAVVEQLLDLVIAPLFYRYQFTEHPVTPDQAARVAERAWAAVRRPPTGQPTRPAP
jgi:AcrR family transcriptional regulator